MAVELFLGQEFVDYEHLHSVLIAYQQCHNVVFTINDSKSVVVDNKRVRPGQPLYHSKFVYSYIKYCCKRYGTMRKCVGKGIFSKKRTFKTGCPVHFSASVDRKKDRFVIKMLCLEHNHDLSKDMYEVKNKSKQKTKAVQTKAVPNKVLGQAISTSLLPNKSTGRKKESTPISPSNPEEYPEVKNKSKRKTKAVPNDVLSQAISTSLLPNKSAGRREESTPISPSNSPAIKRKAFKRKASNNSVEVEADKRAFARMEHDQNLLFAKAEHELRVQQMKEEHELKMEILRIDKEATLFKLEAGRYHYNSLNPVQIEEVQANVTLS